MKFLVSILLVVVTAPGFLSAKDWPQFQGPDRTGVSSETGLNLSWGEKGPKVAWSLTLDEGFGGAAIQSDEVFFLDREFGETDVLFCVGLDDGKERWRFSFEHAGRLPHHGSRGVPSVDADAVYFTSGFGHVHRINRKTHQPDWTVDVATQYESTPPKWGWAQSPLVVGDVVVVAPMSPTVGLAGLNKTTGKEVWRTAPFGDSHSTPTVLTLDGVEQVVFVGTSLRDQDPMGTVISVKPDTGEVLWKTNEYFNKIPIPFPTKIDEERVYLTGGYDCGSAMIRVRHRDQSWQVEKLWDITQGTQMHPPFLIEDHLFYLANENSNHKGDARKTGGLACMNLDGEIVWHTGDDPFMGRGGSLYADGKLLIQDGETGYLRVVEPSTKGFKLLAEADIFGKRTEVEEQLAAQEGRKTVKIPDFKFWSPMALSQGRLIMRGQTEMKCLDLR